MERISATLKTRATNMSLTDGVLLIFVLTLVAKIILAIFFSSGFETDLFLPFVRHFLENFDNPWNYFYSHSQLADEFPYQPLMLYILSLGCAPLALFSKLGAPEFWTNPFVSSFFFKLPTIASDLVIAWCLLKLFPNKTKHVLSFYFLSPIIIYACYMHSQLDLIPTALLFISLYLIKNENFRVAAIIFGLSLSTKLHVIAALPIILIYLFRNFSIKTSTSFASSSALTYLFFVAPFLMSPGFNHMVMHNPQQSRVFEIFATVGDLRVYPLVMVMLIIFGRFALYHKINSDLFDSYLTLVFAVFVLLTVPSPGWYVWTLPFLSMFMIKYFRKHKSLIAPFLVTNLFYLAFFGVLHRSNHTDLIFINTPIIFKEFSSSAQSMAFTLLEASLLSMIILCYRAGIRSNSIYKRNYAFVIGIGGDSGAGKSTLLADVKSLLQGRVTELEGDGDHRWSRNDENWDKYTHLNPKANWLHRQAETILRLKRGNTIKRADYDHKLGQFTNPNSVQANDFIVMSGLHTFYLPKMRKLVDLKIFMDPANDVHTHWKTTRDTKERGYSGNQVQQQLERRRTDRLKYIEPQKTHADLVVHYFNDVLIDSVNSVVSVNQGNSETKSFEIEKKPETADIYSNEPVLHLRLTLNSSVYLDALVQSLESLKVLSYWDYDADLSKQQIVFSRFIPTQELAKLASDLIPNLEELSHREIQWADDYRGTMQLMVLLVMSQLMQEEEGGHVV